jgi:hypothetical protein
LRPPSTQVVQRSTGCSLRRPGRATDLAAAIQVQDAAQCHKGLRTWVMGDVHPERVRPDAWACLSCDR